MGDQYLMTWVDRSDRVTVLRVRGELDAVTADGFAIKAVRLLRHVDGPVAVDLSLLGFIDCAGARTLAAVLDTMLPDRLVGVRGIRRPVSRLIDVIGLDLKRLVQELRAGRGQGPDSRRETLSLARTARWRSRALMLESAATMARLATTYAEIAADQAGRGTPERAKYDQTRALSDTAHDLSARFRQRALATAR
jgi:anti-anti-sigma factor